MTPHEQLIREIEAFLTTRPEVAETTFGRRAVNDGKFMGKLRDGRNFTLATFERVRAYIRQQEKIEAAAQRKRQRAVA
jgi:hypothetical protein